MDTTPVVKTIGSGSDTLMLKLTQDVYKAGAQYTVSVDGKQIGGTLTAGAAEGSGQTDVITVKGDWAAGAHTVTVNFLNDTWGGTSTTDSNLYVTGITYNGKALADGTADLMSNGPVDFSSPRLRRSPLLPRQQRHRPDPSPLRYPRHLGPSRPGLVRPARLRRRQLPDLRR
ncbi:carbohydrate-binding domain-containing protein [Paeniroseomonas aquatica]|uniref:carbohydrate-binding domain-containing protein n=1 Tax=Paeniroseomonas aquatica TaxID=373043 RepID=UPI003623C2A9